MSIKDELDVELKAAMRERDRNRIDVVRQVHSEVQNAVTAPGFAGEADDELYRETIAAYVKKMRKALAEYESYGDRGAAAADKLRFEVEFLSRWLPRAPDEEETAALVDAAIAELGATDMSAMGQVMGQLRRTHPEIDGATASRIVRLRLSGTD